MSWHHHGIIRDVAMATISPSFFASLMFDLFPNDIGISMQYEINRYPIVQAF